MAWRSGVSQVVAVESGMVVEVRGVSCGRGRSLTISMSRVGVSVVRWLGSMDGAKILCVASMIAGGLGF